MKNDLIYDLGNYAGFTGGVSTDDYWGDRWYNDTGIWRRYYLRGSSDAHHQTYQENEEVSLVTETHFLFILSIRAIFTFSYGNNPKCLYRRIINMFKVNRCVVARNEDDVYRLMRIASNHHLYGMYKIGVYGSECQHELFVTGKLWDYHRFLNEINESENGGLKVKEGP